MLYPVASWIASSNRTVVTVLQVSMCNVSYIDSVRLMFFKILFACIIWFLWSFLIVLVYMYQKRHTCTCILIRQTALSPFFYLVGGSLTSFVEV